MTRLKADSVAAGLSRVRGRYSEPFLRAIQWALNLEERDRPQTVEQWKKSLLVSAPVPAAAPAAEQKTLKVAQQKIEPTKRGRWPWLAAGALVVLLVVGVAEHKKHPAAAASAPQESPQQRFRREVEAQFRKADANGDGTLSPDEVARFPFLAREFWRVDTDGDGRISLLEFAAVRRVQLERRLGKGN